MFTQIQDQQSDRSLRVLAEKIREFPAEAREMLKTAEINYDEIDSLPSSAFAWADMRRFPIHTPAHTLMSQVYAQGQKLPEFVTDNLEKAAELHGVKVNAMEKRAGAAFDPDDYLVPELKFGYIPSGEFVKEATDFFMNNYKKMDVNTRAQAACTLVKKAHQYSQKVPLFIYKHAGLTEVNPRHACEWLEVRASLAKDQIVKDGFNKLAKFIGDPEFKCATRGELIKLAETIGTLDSKSELNKKYDISLPDPMTTVFNTTKIAAATVSLGGKNISISKLASFQAKDYASVLGDDILPEISDKKGGIKEAELIDVLKTLPVDLQVTLVKSLGL